MAHDSFGFNINFDSNHNPKDLTFVLCTQTLEPIGALNCVDSVVYNGSLSEADELTFTVHKYDGDIKCNYWDDIKDFKIIKINEFEEYYSMVVEISEQDETVKNITATSLCEVELGQTNLYGLEINTEDDIANDDYEIPTVFFREISTAYDVTEEKKFKRASLLHRVLSKTPHYEIGHVDESLKNIQRTFSADDTDIYSFLTGTVAEEIGILFTFTIDEKDDGTMQRYVNAYDLYTNCNDCGYRGEYTDICPKCGSTHLSYFGEDTTIFINNKNLSQGVTLTVNTDNIKNCFKLEAGDELMTATVINCNPNGTSYIYNINENQKEDMPDELVDKIEQYDIDYKQLNEDCAVSLDSGIVTEYNAIVTDEIKSKIYEDLHDESMQELPSNGIICGYSNLGTYIYESYDVESFLTSEMMPSIDTALSGNAEEEMNKLLNALKWSNVACLTRESEESDANVLSREYPNPASGQKVVIFDNCAMYEYNGTEWVDAPQIVEQVSIGKISQYTNVASCNIAWKNYAKAFTNTGYFKIEIDTNDDEYEPYISSQNGFTITEYEDISYSDIDGTVHKSEDVLYCMWHGRFKITNRADENDVAYSPYMSLRVNDCPGLQVVESVKKLWADDFEDDYDLITIEDNDVFKEDLKKYCLNRLTSFLDAYNTALDTVLSIGTEEILDAFKETYQTRIDYLEGEVFVRQKELDTIKFVYDELYAGRNEVQQKLDFEDYLGEDNYKTFCVYRREQKYSNSNYISDGLSNAQLFSKAEEFIDIAKNELLKSSKDQYTINGTLSNFLLMDEFKPLLNTFKLGNWMRFQVEDKIYLLRLIKYTIDYSSINNLSVEFSDISHSGNFLRDAQSIIEKAASMASSYAYVAHQASIGCDASDAINSWTEDGLSNALITLKNNDHEEVTIDNDGILCRNYDPIREEYSDEQFRITHNMIMFTDDGFKTPELALGKHEYQYYGQANNLSTLEGSDLEALKQAGLTEDDTVYKNLQDKIQEAKEIKWRKDTAFGLSAKFVNAGYITGSQIVAGEIYSENYDSESRQGMYINLKDGSFSFAGGNFTWSPESGVDDIPAEVSGTIKAKTLYVYDYDDKKWKQGWTSGTFTTYEGKIITIKNGVVVDIVQGEAPSFIGGGDVATDDDIDELFNEE